MIVNRIKFKLDKFAIIESQRHGDFFFSTNVSLGLEMNENSVSFVLKTGKSAYKNE